MWATARSRIVAGIPVPTAVGVPQLRQSYIKRHCIKWPPVSRRLLWWQPPLARPAGSCSTFYAKLPALVRACQPSALPGLFQPYAPPPVALVGVLALWHMSGATRMVLVSGFAGHVVLAPAHPMCLACFAASARGLPVRPQGAPCSARANTCRPAAAAYPRAMLVALRFTGSSLICRPCIPGSPLYRHPLCGNHAV